MKRIICLITVLCLILSSFSFCFAADWSDSQITSVVNNVSSINTTLSNIYSRLGTIVSYLYDGNHSVAFWVHEISTWMQPIYSQLTAGLVSETDIIPIVAGLNEVVSSGGNTSYTPYLKYGGKSNANWLSDIYSNMKYRGNLNFLNGQATYLQPLQTGGYYESTLNTNYSYWQDTTTFFLQQIQNTLARNYAFDFNHRDAGYNNLQSLVSFADPDSTVTFTPTSGIDGLYKYLNALNTPLARLGYTLASDQRIEAQEAAAANEQAVVDNFIDSTGDGSASPSDIGSISDLSSGYKSNFGSDAQVTGIFNIFNSNNMGWFSQETANQLDTTTPTRRGSSFDTPLLDQQIYDIYDQIGIKHD